ncbi:hypothetical protein CBZ93_08620 [Salmonella enterica]|nr:hypothetical protein [Salmonella enterica]MBA2999040.1 hypothetical protein [Salmonella enterica subsp. salamae serovar 3,10:b:e,n,x]HAU3145605.1 hypothetical protein [Salmonella enterica subsp. salamae]
MRIYNYIFLATMLLLSFFSHAGVETTFHFNSRFTIDTIPTFPNVSIPGTGGGHLPLPNIISVKDICFGESSDCNKTGKNVVLQSILHIPAGTVLYISGQAAFSIRETTTLTATGTCTYANYLSNFKCKWNYSDAPVSVSSLTSLRILRQNIYLTVHPSSSDYIIQGTIETTNITQLTDPSYINHYFGGVSAYHLLNFRGGDYTIKVIDGCCGIASGSGTSTTAGVTSIETMSNVLITNKLTPESLTASFNPDNNVLFLNVNKSGIGDNTELGRIYLRSDGVKCSVVDTSYYKNAGVCAYSLQNTTVTATCPDTNLAIHYVKSTENEQQNDALMGIITGSWGRVNIDTTCAITVTIPYE